jgi:FdhE protein
VIDAPAGAIPRRGKKGPPRGHTAIGTVARPDFVRLPDVLTLFAARARRFAELAAPDQPLAPFLRFLSQLAEVQHQTHVALPASGPLRRQDILSADSLPERVAWLVQHAAMEGAPAPAEQARARLAAMPAIERLALAGAVLDGVCSPDQLAEGLYMAAALQVHLSAMATQLKADSLAPAADGSCPACGSRPVASMIVGWPNAAGTRYCCCALCGTLWNVVRARCTSCGSTSGMSYASLEGHTTDVTAEICTDCNHYIKHFRQDRTAAIEPFADDIATLGLDLRMQATGTRRATANPLMVIR